MQQTQKWVNLGLLIATAVLFLFLHQLAGALWDMFRLPIPEEWPVEPPQLISFVLAMTAGLTARRSLKANGFLNEVAMELSKVSWPHRQETVSSAGVVIILTGLASLILFLIDNLWGTVIRGILAL